MGPPERLIAGRAPAVGLISHVVLDRDGTLIEHIPYLHAPNEVRLLPTVTEALRRLREAGCSLHLHTNQSGVGRDMFAIEDVTACNEEMLRQLDLGPDVFMDICIAPEAPDAPATYRKPSPRYGREIAQRAGVSVASLCYIGDNTTDLLTAANVGCSGIGVDTGGHDLRRVVPSDQTLSGFPVVESLHDAVELIVGRLPTRGHRS
jgi:D-glycero-D-manno-heptose 1,7-bisphosphate phosphatase